MRKYWEHFLDLCKSRIFVVLCGICLLFFILLIRLFLLQIVNGKEYNESLLTSVSKEVNVPAPRGNIYDRYGRPLAENKAAYSVQIDDSVTPDLTAYRADLIRDLLDTLFASGTEANDALPISKSSPAAFTFEGDEKEREQAEEKWKTEIGLDRKQMDYTADECLNYLYEKYEAPEDYNTAQKRMYVYYDLTLSDKSLMCLTLAQKLTEFGETIIDSIPLDTEYPYSFQFGGSKTKEENWKLSFLMEDEQLSYDSLETLDYLRDFFGFPEYLPDDLVRKAVGIRNSLYEVRYQKYQSVTIATEISDKTLAYVEENQDVFPNVVISTVSLREYPNGEHFSQIIGYIRQMTESDIALYQDIVDAEGNPVYSSTDIVGQAGIEKLYEQDLNGTDGKITIEVDKEGRRMSVISSTDPIPGKDVYLTIDSELQSIAYTALENALRDVLLNRLTSGGKYGISTTELFSTMVNANHISSALMLSAQEGTIQKTLVNRCKATVPDFSVDAENTVEILQTFLTDGLTNGNVSAQELLLCMIEQERVPATPEEIEAVKNGSLAPSSFVIRKLESGEMSPADTALDPSTGSVVVSEVGCGQVLALVTYPSYDNNQLVNTFNNSYYNQLLEDTNTPLVNRPLKQKKAPGSTFKMISAIAGLETGTITPSTVIADKGIFKDAGTPYARCWIYSNNGGTHGAVNVSHALEVSCNYFFYELGYRMGNADNGTTEQSIATLNEYMAGFGLNSVTGIELEEYGPTMASPYYKERTIKTYNPDATSSQTRWTDGDTIRAFIGQSINSYTPAQMNRYIATLANGGTLYQYHLVDKVVNPDGTIHEEKDEVIENQMDLKEENLAAVYEGMYLVANGSKGTMRTAFKDLPVTVAAKTGTAQEDLSRSSHTWLVCFAPYEDPQIAITVMIPFAENYGSPAPKVASAIITEYLGLDYTPTNTNMETVLDQ